MFCEQCGQKITDGSLFCEYCGAKIEVQPQYAAYQPYNAAGAAAAPMRYRYRRSRR